MEYNFIWSTPSAGAPIVSIASYGITFNNAVIEILKRPDRIMIGYDDDNKIIGIKPLYEDDELNSRSFTFMERERNGYVRIGNKDFIKYLSNKTRVDYSKAVRYFGDWDEKEEILIVNLNNPLDGLDLADEEKA